MNTSNFNMKEMKASVEKIEQHILELKALGVGIPVVEKNTRALLSIVNNLKFGIVDPAELMDQ